MYTTLDYLTKGKYFWQVMQSLWPLPFDPEYLDSAVLMGDSGELAVVLTRTENVGDDHGGDWIIQVREVASDKVLLLAKLTPEREFINGNSMGVPVDEASAVHALSIFSGLIVGTWEMQEELMMLGEDDQHD